MDEGSGLNKTDLTVMLDEVEIGYSEPQTANGIDIECMSEERTRNHATTTRRMFGY
ncbi:hypothetical protein AB0758_47295 [Tolypothrix bouteillei VB521301_2]